MAPPEESGSLVLRTEERDVAPQKECAVANRGEEGAVVPAEEPVVANRGDGGAVLPTEESAVLLCCEDHMAAPNRTGIWPFRSKIAPFSTRIGVFWTRIWGKPACRPGRPSPQIIHQNNFPNYYDFVIFIYK